MEVGTRALFPPIPVLHGLSFAASERIGEGCTHYLENFTPVLRRRRSVGVGPQVPSPAIQGRDRRFVELNGVWLFWETPRLG